MTTKRTTTFLAAMFIAAAAFGQQIKQSNAHIGFAYPLSTNGVRAMEYTNRFSAHAITGVSYAETGFCASGIATVIKDSAIGFVASGFANVIGNRANGLQAAGFVNFVRNGVQGAEVAGFINLADSVHGAQVGGFANVASGNVQGAQVAGFANTAGNVTAQVAGFVNIADSTQAQVGGFANIAHTARAQVAGFINVAGNVEGGQVAGFINIAHKVKGAQVAGFINIADSSDCPIGLINIVRHGEMSLGIMTDETFTTFLTFRSGGRKLYGIVAAGYNGSRQRDIYAYQAGLGGNMNISKAFRISAEATATSLVSFRHNSDMQATVRLIPTLTLGRMQLYAGPTFNYALSFGAGGAPFDHHALWTDQTRCRTHELYVGAAAGLQVRL